jgi:MFS family permease
MINQDTSQFPAQRVYWFVPFFVLIITFLIYLPTLAPTITWQYGADSGELAAAVAMFESAPTPAYPTYILLGRAWSALPFGGDVAYRLNLLSATAAALAAAFCAATILLIAPKSPSSLAPPSLPFVLGALLGGIGLASAPLTWAQATITEIYAPGLAFVSLFSYLLILWQRKASTFVLVLAALIAGLGIGVLPQLVLLLPGALGLLLLRRQAAESRKASPRQLMLSLFAFAIGASTYLYLPFQAIMQPQADWAALLTVEGLSMQAWLAGLGEGMLQLGEQLSWLGLLPALLGASFVWRKNRAALAYLLSLISLTLFFAAYYPAARHQVYLMPALFGLALLMGVGLASGLTIVQSRYGSASMALLALLVASLFGFRSMILAPQLNLSNDYSAIEFAEDIFSTMPANAIVVSEHDESTFSLWYQQALGTRQDLVIIDKRLLSHDWYQRHLIHHYPDLDPAALRPGELKKLGRPVYMLIEPVEDNVEDRLIATYINLLIHIFAA